MFLSKEINSLPQTQILFFLSLKSLQWSVKDLFPLDEQLHEFLYK